MVVSGNTLPQLLTNKTTILQNVQLEVHVAFASKSTRPELVELAFVHAIWLFTRCFAIKGWLRWPHWGRDRPRVSSTSTLLSLRMTTTALVKNPLPALTRQPIVLVGQPVVLVGQVQAVFAVRAGQPARCCVFFAVWFVYFVLHQTNQTATTKNTNRVLVALVLWCSFFFKSCSLDFSFLCWLLLFGF